MKRTAGLRHAPLQAYSPALAEDLGKGLQRGGPNYELRPPAPAILPCGQHVPPRVRADRDGRTEVRFRRAGAERLHRQRVAGHLTAFLLFTLVVGCTPPGDPHDKAFWRAFCELPKSERLSEGAPGPPPQRTILPTPHTRAIGTHPSTGRRENVIPISRMPVETQQSAWTWPNFGSDAWWIINMRIGRFMRLYRKAKE